MNSADFKTKFEYYGDGSIKTNPIIMRILLSLALIVPILSSAQDDDYYEIPVKCDRETIKSNEQYENAPSDQLTINSLAINDDCLKINFSSSGCEGDTWELKLVASEIIFFTVPAGRILRLSLKNEELCQTIITKELTFDISNLQVDGDEVILHITNYDEVIMYEY